jgi:hypothetical protein
LDASPFAFQPLHSHPHLRFIQRSGQSACRLVPAGYPSGEVGSLSFRCDWTRLDAELKARPLQKQPIIPAFTVHAELIRKPGTESYSGQLLGILRGIEDSDLQAFSKMKVPGSSRIRRCSTVRSTWVIYIAPTAFTTLLGGAALSPLTLTLIAPTSPRPLRTIIFESHPPIYRPDQHTQTRATSNVPTAHLSKPAFFTNRARFLTSHGLPDSQP